MTSGKEILQIVLSLKLEFLGDPPEKHNSYIPHFSKKDESAIDLEIQKLLAKVVITKCEHEKGEYISPIFIRQKPDGSCKLILNLKNLDEDMPYIHFKLEALLSVLSLNHSLPQDAIWHYWTWKILLLCIYTRRSHQVSKIHLEKSTV